MNSSTFTQHDVHHHNSASSDVQFNISCSNDWL